MQTTTIDDTNKVQYSSVYRTLPAPKNRAPRKLRCNPNTVIYHVYNQGICRFQQIKFKTF